MREAVKVSNDSPVLLDRFLNDATEIDVDAVADGRRVIVGGIMEHVEQAGCIRAIRRAPCALQSRARSPG
jgi:carbamoyl-phosphate synthase large subunit